MVGNDLQVYGFTTNDIKGIALHPISHTYIINQNFKFPSTWIAIF